MIDIYYANKIACVIIAVSIWSLILRFFVDSGGLPGLMIAPIFAIWTLVPCYVIYSAVNKLINNKAILTAIILNLIINLFGIYVYYLAIIYPDALNAVGFITLPAFQLILVHFVIAITKHIEIKYNNIG